MITEVESQFKEKKFQKYFKSTILFNLFSCSVVPDSLQHHGLQDTRLPCPSPSPGVVQTHVHWVSDAIQPSHPLSSPSPLAFNLSQHQGLFQWVTSLHQVAKLLEFQLQHQSFLMIDFLWGWFPLGITGLISFLSKGLLRVLSSTTGQKHQFFSVQPFLWFNWPSIHSHWKNHSVD